MHIKKFMMFATLAIAVLASSCVSSKKFKAMQEGYVRDLDVANKQLGECGENLNRQMSALQECKQSLALKDQRVKDLSSQLKDARSTRDKQMEQVGDLTVLSQAANDNIKETLEQLEKKDDYVQLLQAAKTKADSMNLALAVNLKSVLSEGIADNDVDIKVDKTVVFVNLSDKMVFESGSSNITSRAQEVLGKIAKIVQSRPEVDVMVEGYTDNVPVRTSCFMDNWDLSVKRATSVVRVLQTEFGVDPNKLIAAGRGEYNTLASNDSDEGRATNRRTRIIILPKIDQFYELLNPNNVPD